MENHLADDLICLAPLSEPYWNKENSIDLPFPMRVTVNGEAVPQGVVDHFLGKGVVLACRVMIMKNVPALSVCTRYRIK